MNEGDPTHPSFNSPRPAQGKASSFSLVFEVEVRNCLLLLCLHPQLKCSLIANISKETLHREHQQPSALCSNIRNHSRPQPPPANFFSSFSKTHGVRSPSEGQAGWNRGSDWGEAHSQSLAGLLRKQHWENPEQSSTAVTLELAWHPESVTTPMEKELRCLTALSDWEPKPFNYTCVFASSWLSLLFPILAAPCTTLGKPHSGEVWKSFHLGDSFG